MSPTFLDVSVPVTMAIRGFMDLGDRGTGEFTQDVERASHGPADYAELLRRQVDDQAVAGQQGVDGDHPLDDRQDGPDVRLSRYDASFSLGHGRFLHGIWSGYSPVKKMGRCWTRYGPPAWVDCPSRDQQFFARLRVMHLPLDLELHFALQDRD
jgi:hypothetical protein